MNKRWYRDNLVWFSIALSLFSCGFDGAFLSALMWIKMPTLGAIFGQGLNFAADAATHVLGHQFADEQRKARKGSKRYALSFVLLAGDLAALFYSIAFSWLQIRTNAPDLEPWAQWVTASFAPVVIGLLGVARAFRDANSETKPKRGQQTESEPVPLAIGFYCEQCEYISETQNGLNAHKRKHAIKAGNGHKVSAIVVEEEQE